MIMGSRVEIPHANLWKLAILRFWDRVRLLNWSKKVSFRQIALPKYRYFHNHQFSSACITVLLAIKKLRVDIQKTQKQSLEVFYEKKKLQHGFFPVNIAKFLRTPFLKKSLKPRILLTFLPPYRQLNKQWSRYNFNKIFTVIYAIISLIKFL